MIPPPGAPPDQGPKQGPIAHALGLGRPITQEVVSRVMSGLLGPDGQPLARQTQPGALGNAWFGPGESQPAVAPRGEAFGRAFDYATGYNITTQPRRGEAVDFATLRGLAQAYDLLRLAIETRKDQLSELSGSVQPRKAPHQSFRPESDDRCKQLTAWFRKPDGEHYFDGWMRMLAEDCLVIDAPTLVRRDDRAGRFAWAEVIDGATIVRQLDVSGRTPRHHQPAYQQILKGLPAVNYTNAEIIYAPRNPRPHKAYGLSPTEQVMITVNIGLRRMTQQLLHHTDGNVPEALIGVPETWSLPQIEGFQRYWDGMMRDQTTRRRAKFVPGQFAFQPTRSDGQLMDQYDEWLSRVICYAFSLPPTAFVRMMNRATAETSYQSSIREGLAPMMRWAANVINDVIEKWWGHTDLEWVWDRTRELEVAEQLAIDERELQRGIRSLDDLRAARGLAPVGIGPVVWGVGPAGFMSVEQVKQAIDQGLTAMQPPPVLGPEGMVPGAEGEDPLAGAPPEVLAQLGIAPGAAEGEEQQEEDQGEAAAMAGPPGLGSRMTPRGMSRPAVQPRELVRSLLRQVDRKLGARR